MSQNFSEVFQELVPSGSGQMIIKTSADLAVPKKGKGGGSSSSSESDNEEDESDRGEQEEEEEEEFDEEGQVCKIQKRLGDKKLFSQRMRLDFLTI